MSTYFTHGGVQYPLTASTAKSLLEDADPALFYALDYVEAVIEKHVGPRLLAQAAKHGLNFPSAVRQKLHVAPTPELLPDQFHFPTLAIYRQTESYSERTKNASLDVAEWEYVYVLPVLTPVQLKELHPILRAVSVAVRRAIRAGTDKAWRSGADVWQLARVERAGVTGVRYGDFESIAENPKYFKAVIGSIEVAEQEMPDDRGTAVFDGVDGSLDHKSSDGTTVRDFVQIATKPGPTLTSVTPNSGTKAGGTPVVITGTGFRVGTPVRVVVGNIECTDAEVLDETHVQALTSPHEAYGTFLADTSVETIDGVAELPASFTFTTP